MRDPGSVSPSCPFRHEALFYGGGADGFLAGTLPLIERVLAEEGAVLVAVGRANAAALSEALADSAGRVWFLDMARVGRNPARIIPVWNEFVDRRDGGPILGVGEPVWPGRSAAELDECERHEALLNLAFDGGRGWHLLCPYDLDGLDDHVIEAAQRTHPHLARGRESRRSEDYGECETGPFAGALPSRAGAYVELLFDSEDLPGLRRLVGSWAEDQLLGVEACEELVLAVNEVATNSIFYGGGRGTLRLWRDGESLICEVEDHGRIRIPLVGRIRPEPDADSGRGVWIANQLCDLVQIRSSAAGTVVRVHKSLG